VTDAGRERVSEGGWEETAAMVRVSPRGPNPFPFTDRARMRAALDERRAQGITSVEVFAPAEGGRSFGGLDTIDRYGSSPRPARRARRDVLVECCFRLLG
jgi:hypothetical protein